MNMDGARNGEDLVMQQQDLQQRPRPPENHAVAHDRHNLLPPPSCPRCDSSNTKFCYYNNYSLSQPRYFCKACRRYWTQGGSLRTVPIGGGCRKTKRQRISPSSASLWSGLIPRAQGLSTGGARSQNLLPGLMSRPPLPVVPPLGGSFYPGGSYLSTLAAMQSLPRGGINQGAVPVMGGGGGGRFGSNMALLQGMTFPSLKSPAPLHQQLPPQTHFFPPPQQGLLPPGRFSSWSQNVLNTGVTSSSAAVTPGLLNSGVTSSSAAATPGMLNGGGASGSDQAATSFSPNPSWSDYNPGFNHSQ